MKKKNIIIIILILVFLFCAVGLYYLHTNAGKNENPFKIAVNSNELLTESEEGYNSIKIYQQNNQVIVNAKSEAAFFDGAQFTVATQGKANPSDVKITWTTLGGGTEETETNKRIIAEIKIQQGKKLIFDKKINFMKKAFDAIEDVLTKK